MKNKKGFTLIELLAVIVILAVIMVIAVPKILDVINKSRESAASSSIKLVKDAIKTQVTTAGMSGVTFEKSGGCYTFDFDDQESGNASKLSLKNKEKIGGSIRYCNGIFKNNTLTFDGNVLASSDPKVCIRATTLHTETCSQTDETYYCSGAGYTNGDTITYGNIGTNGTLTSGDAFDCDVDGNGTYDEDERFYYVTDLEGNSNVAVLIYYNNTKDGEANSASAGLIAYDSTHGTDASAQNWHGPVTAITNLPKNNDWKNVGLTKEIRAITNQNGGNTTTNGANTLPSAFSYEGYAARLLTVQEVNKACGITIGSYTVGELDQNCTYLLENTKYSSSGVGNWGYLLENPVASNSDYAWRVGGSARYGGDSIVSTSSSCGVRPVIEVLKSDIEY